tara:strand:+ start:47 stop:364 length:318 start_codon:yes stop_codon:yes gene_type:complete
MKIEVYHNTFGDKDKHVATVNVDDSVEVYSALEHSYRYTNNVMGSWSIKEEVFENGETNGDFNPNVTVEAPLEDGMGMRSTSVGDYMMVNNVRYNVAPVGFEKVA